MMMEQIQLSYHQERLWFIDTFEKGKLYESAPVYHNLPLLLKIEGPVNKQALQQATDFLVNRHAVLRTRLHETGERRYVSVDGETSLPLQEQSFIPRLENDAALYTFVNIPFLLQEERLHRAILFSDNGEQHYFLWVLHHFIADHYSLKLLFRELAAAYRSFAAGTVPEWAAPEFQYPDYAVWQRNLPEESMEQLLFYWKQALKNNVVLEMPIDCPRPHIHIYEGATAHFQLPEALAVKLKMMAAAQQASPKALLLAAYVTLLQHYTHQEEIVVGTPGSNHAAYLPDAAGPVDNLLVLRHRPEKENDFYALLQQVKTTLEEAVAHQDMPFEQLSVLLNPAKDMSRIAFFDLLFKYDVAEKNILTGQTVWQYQETNYGEGKYDLNLLISESEDTLKGYLTYNKLYFREQTIQELIENYIYLLQHIAAEENVPVDDIPYLAPAQQAHLKTVLDNTAVAFPQEETIVSLFNRQAGLFSDHTAVIFNEVAWDYRSLHAYANQFAYFLRYYHQVGKDDFVAVVLPRSADMIGVLLGILKAGACYVPVDPQYPQERFEYICNDSQSKLVVTPEVLMAFLQLRPDIPATAPELVVAPEQTAYVIYTSGTTGRPKGVKVTHRNVVRLLVNDNNLFDFSEKDVWTMFHSYCFDFSVWEMYGALLFGGKLVVVPEMTAKDTAQFLDLLAYRQVTVLNQTPSAFYRLIDIDQQGVTLPALRYVIFGGEALSPYKLKDWAARYLRVKLINMYGITETTVHVTYKEITPNEINHNISDIGKPIPTLGCYVLDAAQRLLPRGATGEIYVFGEGVAAGYLNKPELTAEKFVELPWAEGRRLYRSGDLARILPSGDMEYLGRADNQVKIRGHRIELAETESNLLKHAAVKDALVITRKDEEGADYMVAYYTVSTPVEVKELRLYLQLLVPEYMVPSYFVCIDSFPLTSNGKINRAVLPDPKTLITGEESDYVAPRTPMEQQLATIWQALLGISKIGVTDNFFNLGGHSLKATQLISRIHQQLSIELKLREVFAHPVLEEMAALLEKSVVTAKTVTRIPRVAMADSYPLSPAQKRLWVLHQIEDASSVYNIANAYVISRGIDHAILQQAVACMLDRHEILRTVFRKEGEDVRQYVLPVEAVKEAFTYHDFRERKLSVADLAVELKAAGMTAFNLAVPPLLKISLFRLEEEKYVVAYVMHHIISDGWSINLFFSELMYCYQALQQQRPPALEPLPFQYRDYAVWCYEQWQSGAPNPHAAYWQSQFSNSWRRADVGLQKERPAVKTYAGSVAEYEISASTTQLLKEICRQDGATLFMGLMAAVKALIARFTSLTDIIVGVPVAGRDIEQVERQIGLYVNTLALRTTFSLQDSFRQLLKIIQKVCTDGFEHQEYPFDQLVSDLKLKRDVSRTPLFDIMVVLQNMADVKIAPELRQAEQELEAVPVVYTGESAKFDLTWFFEETAAEGILLRLEFNTDLYDIEAIQQIAGHFLKLLDQLVMNSQTAVGALPLFGEAEWAALSLRQQEALLRAPEQAGDGEVPASAATAYIAPAGAREARLAAAWEEVLGRGHISRTDNFFALGGDSIKALLLISRLKKHNLQISVPDIMRYAVLQEMATRLEQTDAAIIAEKVTGPVPLSPIQQYFLSNMQQSPWHYNQSVMIRLKDAPGPEIIRQSLQALIAHHDMLRAVFTCAHGVWQQTIQEEQEAVLEVHVLQDLPLTAATGQIESIANRIQAGFQLSTGPLFKAALFRCKEEELLLLCAHHLIVDGITWRILLEDLHEACSRLRQQHTVVFTPTHTYKHWVQQLELLAQQEAVRASVDHWEAALARVLPLPADNFTTENREEHAVTHTLILGGEQLEMVIRTAHDKLNADIQDFLLAAVGKSLQQYWQLPDVVVMVEHHGRDTVLSLDLSRTAGWFTAMYPLALPVHHTDTLKYIIAVKDALREHARIGSHYGINRYLRKDPRLEGKQPAICFNYLGQFNSVSSLENSFELLNDAKGAERAADQQRLFTLEYTSAVVDNTLQLSVTANGQQYTYDTITRLLEAWRDSLLHGVEQCEAANNRYLTAGDIQVPVPLDALLKLQETYAVEDIYRLSPMQQSFYFYHLRYPDSTAYFEQSAYSLKGYLQPEKVLAALTMMAKRNKVLRTLFMDHLSHELVQVVVADKLPEQAFIDLSDKTPEEQQAILEQYLLDDRARGFNLKTELPARWCLFRLSEDQFEFVLSYHHIIMDGWSIPLLMQEFQTIYTALLSDGIPALPVPAPYSDYIRWLEQYPRTAGAAYWKQYLSGFEQPSLIGAQKNATQLTQRDLEYTEIVLDGIVLQDLHRISQQYGVTINELVQVTWAVLLKHVSGNEEVMFGAVVSGRPPALPEVERIVGLFINTLPVRIRLPQDAPFVELVRQLRSQSTESLPYHYTPLADIQSLLPGTTLFDHILVFRNYPAADNDNAPWELTGIKAYEPNSYDFTVQVLPAPERIAIRFVYHPLRYSRQEVIQLQEMFACMLPLICDEPETTVHLLEAAVHHKQQEHRKSGKEQRIAMLKTKPVAR